MQIHLVKETANRYSSMDKMEIKSTKTAYRMHYKKKWIFIMEIPQLSKNCPTDTHEMLIPEVEMKQISQFC